MFQDDLMKTVFSIEKGKGDLLITKNQSVMKKSLLLCILTIILNQNVFSQKKGTDLETLAIVSLDSRGVGLDNIAMGNLVRLELEKIQKFEILDKYDVLDHFDESGIDPAEVLSKSELTEMGLQLGADFMLTGSVEDYGNKIIYTLRLIDVKQDRIVKSNVKEYISDPQYLQYMTRISIADLFNVPFDEDYVEKLKSVETPIISDGQKVRLNGPRFGMQFYSGQLADRLTAPRSEGGYNSTPYATVFAYQREFQYVSSGEFQVLLETIISLNGIETPYASPSLTLLNGVRYKGWDFAFGPVFRFSKVANGYYDSEGKWQMEDGTEDDSIEIISTIDRRGDLKLNAGLLVSVGKNFRSGHINLPVNIYYSHVPTLDSHVFGLMLGFNIASKKK